MHYRLLYSSYVRYEGDKPGKRQIIANLLSDGH
jgi:hypothetical protein